MEGLDKTAAPKIVVVCGPTASGKTGLALALSKQFGGEMVGADSMQIYRGLPIGTAAVTPQQAEGVPQHLTGFLPPSQAYSAAEYVADAGQVIGQIAARGALPVVCGGTGLYIESLVSGRLFTEDKTSTAYRAGLQAELESSGAQEMLRRLAAVDPDYAAALHPSDTRRILRALELYAETGKTYAQRAAASVPQARPYNALCLGITFADRQKLYDRISHRVDAMLDEGLLQEAQLVYNNRHSFLTAAQAIGYKEFFPYFENESTLEACTQKLKQATRNYAKRQITWFRHMDEIRWLYADTEDIVPKATELVRGFLAD